MGGAPGIFHREVTGTQAVLRDNGKTIAIQRGSTSCPRKSSSQGRSRITGHVVRNATQTIQQPDCGDDSNAQGQHGCIDGKDECNIGRWRRKANSTNDKDNTPPRRNRRPLTGTGTGTDQTKKPQKQKALCPHCKMFVLHKPDNCTELEANKDKQWPGWKSVHAIA
jgi:hypothetical protein